MPKFTQAFIILSTLLLASVAAHAAGDAITGVEIRGARNLNTEVVKLALTVKGGDTADRALVEENLRRIYNLGYFSDVGANLEKDGRGKKLVFHVVENPIIKEIEVVGSTAVGHGEILNALQTKPGMVYSVPILNADFKRVQKLFDTKGFILNRVADLKFDGEKATIYVEETRIEGIRVVGNTRTREHVVRRELRGVRIGDMYNDKRVSRSLQKIFNLGYFAEVKPRYEHGSEPGKVVFIVEVKEQKTGTATIGGGYSSANGFVGIAEVSQKNWQGRGQTLHFKFEWGGIRTYELGFVEPYLRGKNLSFGTNLYNTRVTQRYYQAGAPTEYNEERKGVDVTLGKKYGEFVSSALTFRDEDIKLTDTATLLAVPGINAARLRAGKYQTLAYMIGRDTRDNVFNPTRGSFHAVNLDTTGGFLRGQDAFTKQKGTMRNYMKIAERDVLATRVMAGSINVTEGSLPLYEEYGAGGVYSLRGYEWREFLGEKTLILNVELRHRISKNFEGVLFFDHGDAWGGQGVRQKFDGKSGYGFGLNFNTPIGPIRLDYGKGEDRGGKSYFSMGRMF